MKKTLAIISLILVSASTIMAADQFVTFSKSTDNVCLTEKTANITYNQKDWKGVLIAIENLKADLNKVTGRSNFPITIGTLDKSAGIDKLSKKNKTKIS